MKLTFLTIFKVLYERKSKQLFRYSVSNWLHMCAILSLSKLFLFRKFVMLSFFSMIFYLLIFPMMSSDFFCCIPNTCYEEARRVKYHSLGQGSKVSDYCSSAKYCTTNWKLFVTPISIK